MSAPIREHDVSDPVHRLWEQWKSMADAEAREALIIHYAPLVKFVAGRVGAGLPANVENSDLVSYGVFGLIDAIDKFDLSRGFKFETYAINRIRGAILDELRALDWVPRSVRARAREIERSLTELEHRLQRTPSEEELADHMTMTLDDLQDALAEISNLGDGGARPDALAGAGRGIGGRHGSRPPWDHSRGGLPGRGDPPDAASTPYRVSPSGNGWCLASTTSRV